ncbi:MAG: hypothetical protein JWM20_420 [Patescibacteria group bacterium]|nr:hypothetical protein [Patescibacteria group bacterium]
MQTNIITIPEQKTPFLPREFFLGEAKQDLDEEDQGSKGKDKKLGLRLVASDPFAELIKAFYEKETLISGISETRLATRTNKKKVQNDSKIFGASGQSSMELDALLWAWKYLLQKLAKGEISPIQRNGLGNIWKVSHKGESFKLFFCINFKSPDVYMHIKNGALWVPCHKFFMKK